MASEVFSVKVNEELKDRIKILIDESGMQGKDFMENIIKLYELNGARDIMPSAMGDIEELQVVTKRIYDIFVGLIERSSNLMRDRESTLKDEIEKKNRSFTILQEKLDKTLEEVDVFRTENENLNNKYQQLEEEVSLNDMRMQEQERNYKNLLDSKIDLIKEYKDKNDSLNGLILEYQTYKETNKELLGNQEQLKNEIGDLLKSLSVKEKAIDKLMTDMEMLKSHNDIEIQKVHMEKEKALLEIREKQQTKIEELNNEYNGRINEYNMKIKSLLDEIEKTR